MKISFFSLIKEGKGDTIKWKGHVVVFLGLWRYNYNWLTGKWKNHLRRLLLRFADKNCGPYEWEKKGVDNLVMGSSYCMTKSLHIGHNKQFRQQKSATLKSCRTQLFTRSLDFLCLNLTKKKKKKKKKKNPTPTPPPPKKKNKKKKQKNKTNKKANKPHTQTTSFPWKRGRHWSCWRVASGVLWVLWL